MKDHTNNPQRLACPECDAALDLCHLPQCSRSGTVARFHCKYKDNYKLPYSFDLVHDIKYYGRLREEYRAAKELVDSLEELCETHGVILP